jgi:hypothetical protein
MIKDKQYKWTKYVNYKIEKHCAMKSLICEGRWDTDVLTSDVEMEEQRSSARHCTKL